MKSNNLQGFLGGISLLVMLSFSPCALASLTMDEQKVLDVSIGNKGMTRVTVKGDSIEEILVHPVSLQDNLRHHGGHLFISPDGLKEPIYVTVMTQKGLTQDLQLGVSSSRGRPVILIPPEEEKKAENLSEDAKVILEGHLDSFGRGIVPPGFQKVSRSMPKRAAGSLKAYGEGYWMLGREEILVYEIENPTNQPVTLSPDMFLIQGEQAVSFDRPVVLPQGKARLVVLRFGTGQVVSLPPAKSTPVLERAKP